MKENLNFNQYRETGELESVELPKSLTLSALDKIIAKRNQSPLRFESLEKEHDQAMMIERGVGELSKYENILKLYLQKFGVDTEIRKIGDKLFQIELSEDDYKLDDLPDGYVYHGSAARAVLERKLKINDYAFPRDVDLAYGGESANLDLHNDLATKYSPDDNEQGHGVTTIADDYFNTRDFTINEVIVEGEKITLTKDCLLDTVRGIVRFTDYEKKVSYNDERPYFINPKILAKALRFISEKEAKLLDEEVYQFQQIDSFHMALHLDRAWSYSEQAASEYVKNLQLFKQIPDYVDSPRALVDYLSENTDYIFRCAKLVDIAKEEYVLTNDCGIDLDELERRYGNSPKSESMRPRK